MAKLVYPICSPEIGEVAKPLADCVNVVLCLTISLVVVGGGHLKFDLKILHKLLSEV
jgi:hypothetical protein